MSASATTFKAAVCAKFGCAPEAYAETVFQHTLYAHARRPARMLRRLWPKFFEDDFALIAAVADLGSRGMVRGVIEAERCHFPPAGILRGELHLRVSGQKLLTLAAEVLTYQPEKTGLVRSP